MNNQGVVSGASKNGLCWDGSINSLISLVNFYTLILKTLSEYFKIFIMTIFMFEIMVYFLCLKTSPIFNNVDSHQHFLICCCTSQVHEEKMYSLSMYISYFIPKIIFYQTNNI